MTGWAETLSGALKNVINPILILVATAGIIYAIVVGIKFVKAEDKGQREEAKAKLISVIIGIAVTAALIALFYWLTWALGSGGLFNEITTLIPETTPTDSSQSGGVIGASIARIMSFRL